MIDLWKAILSLCDFYETSPPPYDEAARAAEDLATWKVEAAMLHERYHTIRETLLWDRQGLVRDGVVPPTTPADVRRIDRRAQQMLREEGQ